MSTTSTIQAGDLRVGNLILVSGEIERVEEIYIPRSQTDYKIITDKTFGVWLNDVHPIELTPTILEELGFEKDGYEDAVWYQKDFPVIGQLCTSDREHPLGNFLFDTETDILKIHYLHQLQNLYWCLCGKELYKPKK